MARLLSEARNKRPEIINRRTASILRSNSPVSSTGSCHGTVVSDDTTSEFFSELEEDFANGDVWNSTGDFNINSKNMKSNNDNIRSTAKKHGRWQPRPQQHVPFSASNIASAFPDFTSVGEVTAEENVITTTGESISLEIARGPKYTPNTASPRQSQPRQDHPSTMNTQQKSVHSTRQVVDPVSRPAAMETPKSIPKANNKIKTTVAQSNSEQKNIARTLLSRSSYSLNPNSNIAHDSNVDQRCNKAFQARVSNEVDHSAMIAEKIGTKITSNNNLSDTHLSKQHITTTVRQKSTRFIDSRHRLVSDEKHMSGKDEVSNSHLEGRNITIDNSQDHTPKKRDSTLAVRLQQPLDHTCNPTQSSTSFLIPWNNNIQSNTPHKNSFPVFTAQGAVQTTRWPHEYVDAVNLPLEEEHIYDMIDDMKSQNYKAQNVIDSFQHKTSQLVEENIHISSRKRSDSGLGDSGSENFNYSARALDTELLECKKLNAYLQHKLDDCQTAKEKLQMKCHNLESKISCLNLANGQAIKKMGEEQRFDGQNSFMAHNLKAEQIKFVNENKNPRLDVEKPNKDTSQPKEESRINDHGTRVKMSNDPSLNSEIWRLSSLYETLRQRNSNLVAQNEELMAENWTQAAKNRELFSRVQELLAENFRLEQDIAQNMGLSPHKKNPKDDPSLRLDEMKLQKDLEASNWAEKTQQYEIRIEKLNTEIKELQTKLARSEKSCKILKSNTERIMESTHEIQATKNLKSQKNSTTRKDKQSKRTSNSEAFTQEELTNKLLTNDLLHQGNDNFTLDSNLTDRSFSDNGSLIHTTDKDKVDAYTFDVYTSSNFSEILGHGFVNNLRDAASYLEEIVAQERAADTQTVNDETINSTIIENTNQSVKSSAPTGPKPSVKSSAPTGPLPSDLIATKSQLKTSVKNNPKRTMSLTEKDTTRNVTVNSHKSVRRHSTTSHGHFSTPDLTKSAVKEDYIDIKTSQKRNVSNSDTPNCLATGSNEKCASENYIGRSRVSSKNHRVTKKTVRIERPIPVSERIPITEPYEDEPTVRPSIPPGLALAKVIKELNYEINNLKNKLEGVHKAYLSHDPSMRKKSRRELADLINALVKKIEIKTEQLYHLYNVLEGQKTTQQEMTEEFVDITLTELGIIFDDTWNGFDF